MGPGFHQLVLEVAVTINRLDPSLALPTAKFVLQSEKFIIAAAKDNLLVPTADICAGMYMAVIDLINQLQSKHSSLSLEQDRKNHVLTVSPAEFSKSTLTGVLALRTAVGTLDLEDPASALRHLSEVIRVVVANQMFMLMDELMETLFSTMNEENGFFSLQNTIDIKNKTNVLSFAFSQCTWYANVNMADLGEQLHQLEFAFNDVVTPSHPTMLAKNPFQHARKVFEAMKEAMDDYNQYLKTCSVDYTKVIKYAINSFGSESYLPMSRQEIDIFLKQKAANVKPSGLLNSMEEKYSSFRQKQLCRERSLNQPILSILDGYGKISKEEIIRAPFPFIDKFANPFEP